MHLLPLTSRKEAALMVELAGRQQGGSSALNIFMVKRITLFCDGGKL